MSSNSFAFSINKKLVFVAIVKQETMAKRGSACQVVSIKTNTFRQNQLISARLEEERRRYQALTDGPPRWLGQGLEKQ